MPAIIVKNYAHINRSLPNWDTPNGRIVKSKDHYDRLMKENNMVSYEIMQQQAESKKLKEYKLTEQSKAIIRDVKLSADSRGNVKLGDRAVKALINKGVIGKKIPSYMKLPSYYDKSGFNK